MDTGFRRYDELASYDEVASKMGMLDESAYVILSLFPSAMPGAR